MGYPRQTATTRPPTSSSAYYPGMRRHRDHRLDGHTDGEFVVMAYGIGAPFDSVVLAGGSYASYHATVVGTEAWDEMGNGQLVANVQARFRAYVAQLIPRVWPVDVLAAVALAKGSLLSVTEGEYRASIGKEMYAFELFTVPVRRLHDVGGIRAKDMHVFADVIAIQVGKEE